MKKKPDAYSMQGKPLPPEKMNEDDVLRIARQRAADTQSFWQENFDRAEKSVRFTEGEQWEAGERAERGGRPCLTLNTLPSFIEQVAGSQRQSRPAIKVIPGDDHGAEMEFIEGRKTQRKIAGAEVYGGIIRAIEQNSGAEAHYDTAFEHTLDGGLGWLRVYTRYASAKDFDQELLIRAVRNRWSVLIDPMAQEPDASDMAFAFIGDEMRKSEFTRRYPEARLGDVVDGARVSYWMRDDLVRVAEYFTREAKTRELLLFSNGQTAYADDLPEGVFDGETLIGVTGEDGAPISVIRRRKVVTWCVYWRKITAWETLEGPTQLPFSTIPVIPVMGRRRDYRDGTFKLSSLIWPAMDAKRMENYWLSAATERVALSPKAPWIATAEAIEGHERAWENANRGNPAVLVYNEGTTPPQRADVSAMPVAELQMASTMSDRVKSTIGMFNPSLGEDSSEKSGRAIALRQRQADNGTFAFVDNLSRALRRIGLLLIEAIPKIYDTERVMRLRNEDGTSAWVKVNQVVTGPDGEAVVNALGQGEFDVVVDTGPSYATQRQEAAEGQMAFLQINPQAAPLIGDKIVRNMDWPGADGIADRLIRTVPPQVLTPQEREELAQDQGQEQAGPDGQPMPPSPEEQQAMAQEQAMQMQAQMAELQMQAAQAETQAKVAKAEAEMETAAATKAKAAADMAEQEVRMAALRMSMQPPVLPTAPMPSQEGQM